MAVDERERTQLVSDLLEQVGGAVGRQAHVSAIFGEAVERTGVTVIPVAKARFGFGGGGGLGTRKGDEGAGGGGGGGGIVTPVGYIEVRDGRAEFTRITSATDWLALAAAASLAIAAARRLLG